MPPTARFLWQIAVGLAVGLAAVGLTWLFDSVWPGVLFLLVWVLGYRVWWYRRQTKRPRSPSTRRRGR